MVKLFSEEAAKIKKFLTAVALRGSFAVSADLEQGTIVDSFVIEISPKKVGCRMLDEFTRTSAYLDVSFEPSIPGEVTDNVGIEDISDFIKQIAVFDNEDTLVFEKGEDELIIHDRENNTKIYIPLKDVEQIPGYSPEAFSAFDLDADKPAIHLGDDKVFDAHADVVLTNANKITSLAKALSTPVISVKWNKEGIFVSTHELEGKGKAGTKHSSIKLNATLLGNGKKVGEVENEYPIGLLPALKEFEQAEIYMVTDGWKDAKQILLKGEADEITKKYVIAQPQPETKDE